MSEQQCVQCTWDGVRLVKMCKHHAEIDRLQQRLSTAEAAMERMQTREKSMLSILRRVRSELNDLQKSIAGDIGELLDPDEAAKGWRNE